MNRQSSFSRKSSMIPKRISSVDRDRERDGDTFIPKPHVRSASSDRLSMKPQSKSKFSIGGSCQSIVAANFLTPQTNKKLQGFHSDLPFGARPKSPCDRLSSLSGNKALNAPKKDTRPIQDKLYQLSMLNRVDQFFKNNNLLDKLNPNGSLKSLTLTTFISVTKCLLALLDVKFEFDAKNYLEKIPIIAKRLHYPGIVTKSWLQTANAMHSWPQALSWICWLVEICQVNDLAKIQIQLQTIPFVNNKDGEVINRNKFIIMLDCYQAWNNANSTLEQNLIDQYLNQITVTCGATEEDEQKVEAELEKSEKKFKEIDDQYKEILTANESLLNANKILETCINKNNMNEAEKIEYLSSLELKIIKLQDKGKELDIKKEKLLIDNVELNECIKNQKMNVNQRNELIEQSNDIKKYISQFEDHLIDLKNESWALDLQYSNLKEKLRKKVLDFNKDLIINIKNSDKLKLPESFTNVNIIDTFREKSELFTKMYNDMRTDLNNLKLSIDNKNVILENLKEKKQLAIQDENEWQSKIDEKKLFIKNLKSQTNNDKIKLIDQINELKDNIKDIKIKISDTESEINDSTLKLQELNKTYEDLKKRKVRLEASAVEFFEKFYAICADSKRKFYEVLQQYEKLTK